MIAKVKRIASAVVRDMLATYAPSRASALTFKSFACALALAALALALLDQSPDAKAPATAGPGERPNVLVIMTDDMRWDDLEHMPLVQSLLADEGLTFSNAFVTTPLCCPSRASFLSGQYVHHHAVWSNVPPEGGVQAFDDSVTLATRLHDAGYQTGLVGKYLNGYAGTINAEDASVPRAGTTGSASRANTTTTPSTTTVCLERQGGRRKITSPMWWRTRR